MTIEQIKARKLLKDNRQYLTHQQLKTLDGQIKAGDVQGALNGLNTIMLRQHKGNGDTNGNDGRY